MAQIGIAGRMADSVWEELDGYNVAHVAWHTLKRYPPRNCEPPTEYEIREFMRRIVVQDAVDGVRAKFRSYEGKRKAEISLIVSLLDCEMDTMKNHPPDEWNVFDEESLEEPAMRGILDEFITNTAHGLRFWHSQAGKELV